MNRRSFITRLGFSGLLAALAAKTSPPARKPAPSRQIWKGEALIWGCPPMRPIVNVPAGWTCRVHLRPDQPAVAFIRSADRRVIHRCYVQPADRKTVNHPEWILSDRTISAVRWNSPWATFTGASPDSPPFSGCPLKPHPSAHA